jgi:hypothetical protein
MLLKRRDDSDERILKYMFECHISFAPHRHCTEGTKVSVGVELRSTISILKRRLEIKKKTKLVVKALGYKPKGRGLETRWGEILNLPNPSGRTRP